MINSAVKKRQFVKCEFSASSGKTYQIIDFDEFIYLADMDAIADGVERMTPADFWKVSGSFFKNNFSIVES